MGSVMKLPWVSREAYTAMETRAVRAEEAWKAADARFADILARFTMLRLQGATEPAPAPTVPVQPVEKDLAKMLINAKFTGNRAPLRAMALRTLASDRARGVDEGKILAAIEAGVTIDEGVPG